MNKKGENMKWIPYLVLFAIMASAAFAAFSISFNGMSANEVVRTNGTATNTTLLLNITNAADTGYNGTSDCAYYIKSTDGILSNTSWFYMGSNATDTYNNATHGRVLKYTLNNTVFGDSNNTYLNASCINGTGGTNVSTTLQVTLDLAVPGAPSSPSISNNAVLSSSTAATWTVTRNDTTGCTLWVGQRSYAMTISETQCTYTIASTLNIPDGTYPFVIQATDGWNTTNSTLSSVTLNYRTENQRRNDILVGGGQVVGEQKQTNWAIIAIIVIVIILAMNSKKKR